MTRLGQLKLERKNREDVQCMLMEMNNVFDENLSNRAEHIEREIEDNKMVFSREVEKMSDEERLSFYERKNEEKLLPADRETNASEREKRRLRKRARSQAKSSNKRYVKLRRKVYELAKDYNVGKQNLGENFDVESVERFEIPSYYTKQQRNEVMVVKKNVRKCREKYLSLRRLYTDMENGDNENIELFNMVANEYENAYGEWNHMVRLAEELGIVENQEPEIVENTCDNMSYEEKEEAEEAEERKHNAEVENIRFLKAYNEQIKKQDIDWEEDFDTELEELESEFETLKAKKDKNAILASTHDYQVEINTLRAKSLLKKEMDEIIEEKRQQNTGKVPTRKEIENEVNNYLKKVMGKAELRTRSTYKEIMTTLKEKMYRGRLCDNYVENMFTSKCKSKFFERFRFGFCGGKNPTEYEDGKRTMENGEISVKLNKAKYIKTTSVLLQEEFGGDVEIKARDISDPDILATVYNLKAVYKRALEVKNGAELLSPDEEARIMSSEGKRLGFHCAFLEDIDASTISEMTYMNISGASKEEITEAIRNNNELKEIYMQVKQINANPERYKRDKHDPLMLTVRAKDGTMISYKTIKSIYENNAIVV